jgi:hypothetical protein
MMTKLPRTAAANHARQQSIRDKLAHIDATLRTIRRERTAITYPAVARRAGVSRTFLYQNAEASKLITAAIAATSDQRRRTQAAHDAHIQASWHQRALNAEDALKIANAEIDLQRERIGILLGQLRDLQAEYTEGTAQRLAIENTTLKQRVRQLTDQNRGIEQNSKPRAPTTASSTSASPTSKPHWSTPSYRPVPFPTSDHHV